MESCRKQPLEKSLKTQHLTIPHPPYVRSINLKESDPLLWDIYRSQFHSASTREWDIYLIFVEKGLSLLNRQGKLGFILPNKFLNSQVGENLRSILAKGKHLEQIVHFGAFQVFTGATTYTCLLFLDRKGKEQFNVDRFIGSVKQNHVECPMSDIAPESWVASKCSASELSSDAWQFTASEGGILKKLKQFEPLDSLASVFQGTGTRADKVYMVEEVAEEGSKVRINSPELETEHLLERDYLKLALRGRNIGRYELTGPRLHLIVPYQAIDDKYALLPESKFTKAAPRTLKYLRECKPRLDAREKGRFKGQGWYRYGRPQNLDKFEVVEKLVMPDVVNRGQCYLDREGMWLLDTAYALVLKPKVSEDIRYVLAILNSPLLGYFLSETGTALRGGYFRMKTAYLNPFPIRTIDFTNKTDKAAHDRIVKLVESMLALHKQRAAAKSEARQATIQRQIDATDDEIDRLVYELYGLTDKEIAIVEAATA